MIEKFTKFVFFIWPFLPLVEAFFAPPYRNFKSSEFTIPFLQIFFVALPLLLIVFLKKRWFKGGNIFSGILLVFIIFSTVFFFNPRTVLLSILTILVMLVFSVFPRVQSVDFFYSLVNGFLASLIVTSLLRIMMDGGFVIWKFRSGSNIYGGSLFWYIAILAILIGIVEQREKFFKLYYFFLNFFAILFANRIGMVLVVPLLLYLFIRMKHREKLSFFIGIAFLVVIVVSLYGDVLKKTFEFGFTRLANSFASYDTSGSFGEFIDKTGGDRWSIWLIAFQLWLKNPIFGIGIGNFAIHPANVFGFSSAHNFILNLLTEGGIVLFGILLTIIVSFHLKAKGVRLLKALFFLGIYFTAATISGNKLFQVNGYASIFQFVPFLLMARLCGK